MKRVLLSILICFCTISLFAQEKRSGVKSGMYLTESQIMGMKVETTVYFDDYCNKLYTYMEVGSPMGAMAVGSIRLGEKEYSILYDQKLVQENPISNYPNFYSLTPEQIEEFKIKEEGKETILGRECTIYSFEFNTPTQGNLRSKVWIWEGIPLKSVASTMGTEVTTIVTKLDTDIEVDPAKFEVPKF